MWNIDRMEFLWLDNLILRSFFALYKSLTRKMEDKGMEVRTYENLQFLSGMSMGVGIIAFFLGICFHITKDVSDLKVYGLWGIWGGIMMIFTGAVVGIILVNKFAKIPEGSMVINLQKATGQFLIISKIFRKCDLLGCSIIDPNVVKGHVSVKKVTIDNDNYEVRTITVGVDYMIGTVPQFLSNFNKNGNVAEDVEKFLKKLLRGITGKELLQFYCSDDPEQQKNFEQLVTDRCFIKANEAGIYITSTPFWFQG